MPIVFVHGVNNRVGDGYQDNQAGRDEFLREVVAPSLGLTPKGLHIENPYWGGHGVQFAWSMAVLPDAEESYEKFGAKGEDEAFERTVELVASSKPFAGSVVARAKTDLEGTLDLLYGAALAGATARDDANDVAKAYLEALAYVQSKPDLAWLDTANDNNFADLLNHEVYAGEGESFGAGGLLDKLKEGLSRLVQAAPDVGTELLNKLARKSLNAKITRFTGDAFVYLAKRGTPGSPGNIVDEVMKSLVRADTVRKESASDTKLVVIAHSFGGEIMYDILTRFMPDLTVDCFITVGSQVGLFEEMKLYLASDPKIPLHYPDGKVPRPSNVKRWLNVFDMNDVLSYRVNPVFDGTDDFMYETGYSTIQAHGGYFLRPSFYSRLATRLKA